ncbi:formate--tetrahydrofolate ligase [Pradoshia sp. D12]|uniref:formate--tetrahydrofolate ligase n=1 Tax=Bacillaceae TaxID=186817 RepID=UPI001120AFEE|nr:MULTISPECIES: formate--tetrahydrofolate ligase [Bacillaceae]QFK71739.1 formate--tetrahydrofolate ligase [Pradoshia sp. D12]TPF73534.1 formate--tetrahydrofolate ligase [Bacillus sp. D12]
MNLDTIVKSDIEIALNAKMKPIKEIAETIGLKEEDWEAYGKYKAKISLDVLKSRSTKKDGKLILVTSINPTKAGEGKSTVTVGLGDAFSLLGKKAMIAMREPSLGPVMGVKGGATGGGYSQVLPMDEINLHFTGDLHAITTANNALAALIDNHIQQGNELQIDPRKIIWKRVLDMNDRALRHIVIGLGGDKHGIPREDGFDITVASEIMAILCLAIDLDDLKDKLGKIVIGYTYQDTPVSVSDLGVEGALTLLLKDALKPNLVQTIEHTPTLIHCGPFANIAHGCNSVLATKTALKLADYCVTEAGFGADLGGEKFLNIKTSAADLTPDAVVIVATLRALKMHGGVQSDKLKEENLNAIELGFQNLVKHCETIQAFGLPFIVALNKFSADTDAEVERFNTLCQKHGLPFSLTEVWEKGGQGGLDLAAKLEDLMKENTNTFKRLYESTDSIQEKIEKVAKIVYGAQKIEYSPEALQQIHKYESEGWGQLPVCMAKTQYSLSDNPSLLGRPEGFTLYIKKLKPSVGAGFIVVLTGDIMTMPGLPKRPAALKMDVDENGNAVGLF